MTLIAYIDKHCRQVTPDNKRWPVVDLGAFLMAAVNDPTADELKAAAAAHEGKDVDCDPFDGGRHGQAELAAWIGDAKYALFFCGLADLTGAASLEIDGDQVTLVPRV